MTISSRVEVSHKYSFNSQVRAVFRIIIVPERVTTATGFHYIILLDTSGSMYGVKLDTAKNGAIELLQRIPRGNKITFITFSSSVNVLSEYADAPSLVSQIQQINAGGQTVLYTALGKAIEIAKKYETPGYIILLTDGQPTDVTDITPYEKVALPPGFKVIAFGIGDDYNEQLLKTLADKSGGILNHINDPMEVANALPQAAVTEIGAKNVTVDIISESPVKLLNYPGPPVKLGAIEGVVRILGEVTVPPNYTGNLMTVKVNYEDPASGRPDSQVSIIQITPARDTQSFLSGINNDLLSEYQYYALMNKLSSDLSTNNLTEATRTLQQMQQLAQQTRKIELMETTRRLQQSLETTRRLGNTEQTKKLSKEVSSEVTKKLRS
ncbi:vWA domain-containing protein [Stygiolobus azoricus]|uniref:VWA domain-containing protein n=1 Tax=Stygiolobus azoricus TaxID=41675 RepID=A0A650CMT1_9CREN|nr:VWA domain-containing protein [Stygiolobus azoricus]QGR19156.1 VWA domain-containing protein [Stygiolobus azoricus]